MRSRVEEVSLTPVHAVAIRATVPQEALPAFFGSAFHELEEVARKAGTERSGPPFARYHSVPPAPIDVEVIMPVSKTIAPSGRVCPVELPAGQAVQVRHFGPYDDMGPAYAALGMWMSEHGLQPSDAVREVYLTSPQTVPDPAKWETLVIQPVQPGGR
jgi:effector-binding domain-containing protein